MANLAYVTLQVGDIPRVRDWYVAVVGLKIEHETEEQIAGWRGGGDCRLCLGGLVGVRLVLACG